MMLKVGSAEVLFADGSTARGEYEVTLVRESAARREKCCRTHASGIIRLGDGHSLTLAARALLVRFDRKIELPVRASYPVHEAEFFHFTSEDAAALED